jgi:hypothetical protein
MSECSICGEYSDCLHPVNFHANPDDPKCPEEIKPFLGIGEYLDDLDASEADDDFWDNCAHLCHKCFSKFKDWISWWG